MFKITSWNINSVRARLNIVEDFIKSEAPDVLCFQEIKVQTDMFPSGFFEKLGYGFQAIAGQKGHHGVATISKHPIENSNSIDWCQKGDARHISTSFAQGLTVHNFYVPAGGDIPDVAVNDKFAHKLQFLNEMTTWSKKLGKGEVLLGDLNIAPLEHDVWSSKALNKTVSHTPIEREILETLFQSHTWVDAVRHFIPPSEKLYSWWSYRAKDWLAADKGRRLDHIWVSHDLSPKLLEVDIFKTARGWEKPSDHAPVSVCLKL